MSESIQSDPTTRSGNTGAPDRELLELAAKAAGIGGGWDWPRGAKQPTFWRDSGGKAWNPLADDADALRLAVKLRIGIGDRLSTVTSFCHQSMSKGAIYCEEIGVSDPYAATRRAITRAAAAIGRTM